MKPGSVFFKMTGSGNDFVMFDGRHVAAAELTPETIAAICDRRMGIGADGVGLLEPTSADGVHFSFHYWNRDGSVGPMCGNGALCATRLAVLLEYAKAEDEVRFATPAGLHRGRVVGSQSEIAFPDCPMPAAVPKVRTVQGEKQPLLVDTGVPHLILTVDAVDPVPVAERGPGLRRDPALGPLGANVNWLSPRPDGTWDVRTFERGVEAETLACGTGAVACALSVASRRLGSPPVRIWTRSGLPLDVSFSPTPSGASGIRLRGEGRVVFRGITGTIASEAPAAP